MRLDPVSLRLFVAVVETGTILAAAEREHVAASAASRRLSELEATLNTTLLERTNKGVAPTAAGLALANLARGVLHSLDEIGTQMADYASGLRGQVRIAANISAITQFLPGEIKAFLESHPGVDVRLEEMISTRVQKAVAENQADVGVFAPVPSGEAVETFAYHDDRLAVIVPRGHALAERGTVRYIDTLDHDFVGLHTGSAINLLLVKEAAELDCSPKLRIQVTSYEALCLMVESGIGIGFLPEAVARRYADTLTLIVLHLDEPWALRSLKLCVRALGALPPAARMLVDHLRRNTGDAAQDGPMA
jgi:DNA-binding transcriptional LysR family regulator